MAIPKDNSFFVALEVARGIQAEMSDLQAGLKVERDVYRDKVFEVESEEKALRQELLVLRDEINESLSLVSKDTNAFKPSDETAANNMNINPELELSSSEPSSFHGK